ncbi:hypothetical protein ACFYUY_05660 [Kitasatospora sp. NPDC004745]|uniref:hypothetical protein n=1 Tax=Kitasatospora sp. NPDC004745 TaxID=3364019 RepID=UPI00369297A5
MTTETTTTATAGGQADAGRALLALLITHPDLPTPNIGLQRLKPSTGPWMWGVRATLHDDLGEFEQWRAALDLAPAAVDHKQQVGGTLAWLIARGTPFGVPLELVGFYELSEPAIAGA